MFTRILVPLDGSAPAQRALPVAARLARALDGTLILMRVAHPPLQPASSLAPPLEVEADILSEDLERAKAYLAQVTQQPELTGIKYEILTPVGYPAEMILDAVSTHQADSILLGSHGRTGLLRWALGSVAQQVIHHAKVPVLLLHQQGPTLAVDARRPLRELVTLDGSGLAEVILGPAATLVSALAPQGQGVLHLVRVVKVPPTEPGASASTQALLLRAGLPPLVPPTEPGASASTSPEARTREAVLQEAQDYLSRVAENLRKGPLAHLQVTWSAIADRDVAGALVDLALSGQTSQGAGSTDSFDLIAMATHGWGGLQRLMMGSMTERVLSASKLPLLVMRPKEVSGTNRFNATPTTKEAVPT